MSTFVILAGAGLIGGVVVGGALALARARGRWVVAVGVVLLAAWLVHVLVNVRGCPQPECGENAYPLSLTFGFANFLVLVVVGVATHALVTAVRGRSEPSP